MSRYPYKPLNLPHETRILVVSPGAEDDKLVCSLSHMVINSSGQYDALSYCWNKSVSHPPNINFDEEYPVALYGDGVNESHSLRLRDARGHPYFDNFFIRMGGVLPPEEILCDGNAIEIGGELYRALRRMRSDEEPLRIWVDALCINQNDVSERNEHVKMMGSIYAHAAKVRVWLGDEIGVEWHANNAMSQISSIFEEIIQPGSISTEMVLKFVGHPEVENIEWDNLGGFLRRSWFERSWVIQEIANAKEVTVQSGRFVFSWDMIYAIMATLRRFRFDSTMNHPNGVKAVILMGDLRQERQDNNGGPVHLALLDLLEELRNFQSTIPADKIYAILGLVAPHEQITVDYGKTSKEIFTDFAIQRLQTGSLDILTHCVFSPLPSALAGLPSWVPDWTRSGAVEPFRIRGLRVTAAGTTKPQIIAIDAASGSLKLKGRVLDTIEAIDEKAHIPWDEEDDIFVIKPNPDGSMPSYQNPTERYSRRMEEDRLRIKASVDNIMTNIAFPGAEFTWEQYEAAWRTFMCNRTRENETPGPGYGPCWERMMGHFSFNKDINQVAEEMGVPITPFPDSQRPAWMLEGSNKPKSPSSPRTIGAGPNGNLEQVLDGIGTVDKVEEDKTEGEHFGEMTRTFIGAYGKWCYRRRFYRTKHVRYGWAVDGTKPGDVVALFYGCDYPFVLRKDGTGQYQIIGDCYIHGLMDGEGLDAQFPEEVFHLI